MNASGGYENAPATRMLATHCAVCRRPLVDAVSVDTGIGPECRKKHGYDVVVDENARAEANRIVYQIALEGDGLGVAQAAAKLNELGFEKLSAILLKRCCPVRIEEEGNLLAVKTPYSEYSVQLFRQIRGRRWDGERKLNTFPCESRKAVWMALVAAFGGMVALGPKGPFLLQVQS